MSTSLSPVKHELIVRNVLSVLSNGAAIFIGTTVSGETVKVVATSKSMTRVPTEGETWSVDGPRRRHELHGWQIYAVKCIHVLPRGRLIERYLIENFKGVGAAKASLLWNAFGERLVDLLRAGDVAALAQVVSMELAERIILGWKEKRGAAELIGFLDAHGLDWALSSKLIRVWGDEALAMLTRNPYQLIAFEAWSKVDAVGIKVGIARDDARRQIGAVEATIYDRLLDGHTLTDVSTLVGGVERRLKRRDGEVAIQQAVEVRAIVGEVGKGYQAAGAAALERGVSQRIVRMLATEPEAKTCSYERLSWVDQMLAKVEDTQGFRFNSEQRCAAQLPFQAKFSVVCGGAGVGKTAVLRAVVALAAQAGIEVIQLALAGMAAKKMATTTGRPAMTIAKFLTSVRIGRMQVSDRCLLVIDEASMLDLPTIYRIFQFSPDNARFLLTGDSAQLPPLNFGLVFHRLVDNPRVPCVTLTQTQRQAESSGIPSAADAVRNHRLPSFVPFRGVHSGVSFIDSSSEDVGRWLHRIGHEWRQEEWRALSPLKIGATGSRSINAAFHLAAQIHAETREMFIRGEPVMHLTNDYDKGLMNGSLGRIVGIHDDGGVVVDFEGENHSFRPVDIQERIELAYAISVHKAQGSQFGRVAIVVGKSRILDNSLMYTALTRGVHQVVFVGDRTAFENAVREPEQALLRSVAFGI